MPIHQIKVGDYLRELCIRNLKDELTEEYYVYYLVLDVSDNTLEVISYAGSALHTKTVHEIEDIQNEYSVSIIENVESKYVYRTYTNNGNLTCQEHTGTQYSWNGKTVLIPVSSIYFTGNGIWRDRPTGF